METSAKPLADICVEVGYNDPKYFSRVFKKKFHLSPSDYRAKPR